MTRNDCIKFIDNIENKLKELNTNKTHIYNWSGNIDNITIKAGEAWDGFAKQSIAGIEFTLSHENLKCKMIISLAYRPILTISGIDRDPKIAIIGEIDNEVFYRNLIELKMFNVSFDTSFSNLINNIILTIDLNILGKKRVYINEEGVLING
jgi:hypothetical protein